MILRCAAVLAALLLFPFPYGAFAQPVVLSSEDGSMQFEGDLLGFDGEYYRIDSKFGPLTLSSRHMACTGLACPDPAKFVPEVRISGAASTGDTLLPGLVEAFARAGGFTPVRRIEDDTHFSYDFLEGPGGVVRARIWFRVSTTAEGFADLLASQADMAMAFRPVSPLENQRAIEAELGDLTVPERSTVVALDALVPIVSPKNTIPGLTLFQIATLFDGTLSDWSELQGPPGPVRLYLLPAPSSVAALFNEQVMARWDKTPASNMRRMGTNSALADAVAADLNGIGVTTLSEVGGARAVPLTGACGLGVDATPETLKTAEYPLVARHRLYTPSRMLPATARQFLSFLVSPEGRAVTRKLGYVAPDARLTGIDMLERRVARAEAYLGDALSPAEAASLKTNAENSQRLTYTFRFEAGTAELDPVSAANLIGLAGQIDGGQYAGRELILAGFTDSSGPPDANQRLSLRRSLSVLDHLKKLVDPEAWAEIDAKSVGFGETFPIACDDLVWGPAINRRVEVWVR